MITLEELLDNYITYRDAFEVAMEQLQQADEERDSLYEENCSLKEKNEVLLKRLIERDLEAIKMSRRMRELVKELARYRMEDVK